MIHFYVCIVMSECIDVHVLEYLIACNFNDGCVAIETYISFRAGKLRSGYNFIKARHIELSKGCFLLYSFCTIFPDYNYFVAISIVTIEPYPGPCPFSSVRPVGLDETHER